MLPPMPPLHLKPGHKFITAYYAAIGQLDLLGESHEGAVSAAFHQLLGECAAKLGWAVVGQKTVRGTRGKPIRVDGAIVDRTLPIPRGIWEAKDEADDLDREVKKKFDAGYPKENTLFQAPGRAVLWQANEKVLDEDIRDPKKLIRVLELFFDYRPPIHDEWEKAVDAFKDRVPELAQGVLELIGEQRKKNDRFKRAFANFIEICRRAINPNISDAAVEEMLIQHLLTERIFRKVFNNPDFIRRNAIAIEIEKVIDALTSKYFTRQAFLQSLDHFYRAIENTAETIYEFSDKQHFLNTVYEKFFQGFSVKVADTHGIVYTPQPIVRFMVKSVEEILQKEFGRSLSDKGVHVLDPFVGTGNFILHIMQAIKKSALPYKYEHELHCNEIMLLPYYIASLNIEHEYLKQAGEYKAFQGVCLVDTFELAEDRQRSLFTEENTARVERQKKSPITVIVGNPPYNAWQIDENDRNKNRKYQVIDARVGETYAKDSAATLVNSLSDPYVKAFRWASDRLGDEGILAYVSNNSYVAQLATDGMRKHLARDFDSIYVLDLGGNVRKNPKLSGTTHNVFGIQVGVAIGLFVRRKRKAGVERRADIYYARTDDDWRKERKYQFLDDAGDREGVKWERIKPDERHTWLNKGLAAEFQTFVPLVGEAQSLGHEPNAIFCHCTMGAKSNSDAYVYDFDRERLLERAAQMVDAYNAELLRWRAAGRPGDIDAFLRVDERSLKWIRRTKRCLVRNLDAAFDPNAVQRTLYRPFVSRWHFSDATFNEDLYGRLHSFPPGRENIAIIEKTGTEWPPFAFATKVPSDHLPQGGAQGFPLHWYDTDDSPRRDNITDWALTEFRRYYSDKKITKWDIFHYVYALLHHPTYRERYAENLKRELPRIPFAPDFRGFARAGKRLAELHVDYEKQKAYRLTRTENPDRPFDWRVEKMKLARDKASLIYNECLTLSGIPPETYQYRLGNRSALEWIVDQYQVSTDGRSGIESDPNRADDPEYIVRLIGQVITVSLETVRIVGSLPVLGVETGGASEVEG